MALTRFLETKPELGEVLFGDRIDGILVGLKSKWITDREEWRRDSCEKTASTIWLGIDVGAAE